MSNKYNRHQAVISRNSEGQIDEDHWLKQFQKKLIEKDAVQPKSIDSSLFDQISSIMNGKSKYPSVAAAVEDMKERSGLTAFLSKTSNDESDNTKIAGQEKTASGDENAVINKKVPLGKRLPTVIVKCPHVKNTFENVVKGSRGNLSIPAIIDRVRSIHQNDVSNAEDWEADDLMAWVSGLNLQAKRDNPTSSMESANLGRRDDSANTDDIDPANTDAFSGLVPAKF